MNKTETVRKKILSSEEFVLSETKTLQYTYGLKHVSRYGIERSEPVPTESVAEHVYALHVLADYFLPLEDLSGEMDRTKVHDLLQYHDIGEIDTGDVISYLKTPARIKYEAEAEKEVIKKLPLALQDWVGSLLTEYHEQKTAEAKFCKAIDKIEPLFHLYTANGKKVMTEQGATREQASRTKSEYIKPYPILNTFHEVIEEAMDKEGYFD